MKTFVHAGKQIANCFSGEPGISKEYWQYRVTDNGLLLVDSNGSGPSPVRVYQPSTKTDEVASLSALDMDDVRRFGLAYVLARRYFGVYHDGDKAVVEFSPPKITLGKREFLVDGEVYKAETKGRLGGWGRLRRKSDGKLFFAANFKIGEGPLPEWQYDLSTLWAA